MREKLFLVSAATVTAFDHNKNFLFEAKTLSDTSLEVSLSNTDVRGGQGNPIQYIFYHSPEMSLSLTETQFNLDFLALSVGSTVTMGADIWAQEDVTLVNGAGEVKRDPITGRGSAIYGYVTLADGEVERVVFNGRKFNISDSTFNGVVCVKYYNRDNAAKRLVIPSSIMPANIELVVQGILASSNATGSSSSTNKVGRVIMTFPSAQMTGAFTLGMTADGVASTPLSVRILASEGSYEGCSEGGGMFGEIIQQLDGANWFDGVQALAVVGTGGNNVLLDSGQSKMLDVRAIRADSAFKPDYDELTFDGNGVSVTDDGVVTGSVSGGTVEISITDKPSISTLVTVTPN